MPIEEEFYDPGEKRYPTDELAACPICNRGFWQRSYLVNGHISPETCGFSCGQRLRAQRAVEERGSLLTPREAQILDLAKAGAANKVIAERLGIKASTVKQILRVARIKASVS